MVEAFMLKALELARKGIGFTSPNPCVGAVIVKGGLIVGEGCHIKAGSDHAEIVAIKNVMAKSGIKTVDLDPNLFHNATLYVTLEPCCHRGKTSPCVEAIVAAGFQKVCIGMKDPFKKVNGRGIRYLKDHGIEVELCKVNSKLAEDIRAVNQPFIKHAISNLPYVVMKAGITLDGKIATKLGDSKWITSEKSRNDARNLRSQFDCVIVGSSTVIHDDPVLGTSAKFSKKNLIRVIIDGKLRCPIDSKIFRDENVLVACCELATKPARERYKKAGIDFMSFGRKEVSIKKLLQFLARIGIQSVFVEGGSGVNGCFFDESLKDERILDKVVFYVAPKLLGGTESISVIGGQSVEKIGDARNFIDMSFEKSGDDLKVTGVLNFY